MVDDDEDIRRLLADRLALEGYDLAQASSAAECRASLEHAAADLVLLDNGLPDDAGLEVLREIRSRWPETIVVMLTGDASIDTAVRAIRDGAYNYLTKPVDLEQIAIAVARALETRTLRRQLREARATHVRPQPDLVLESPTMRRVDSLLTRFARSPASTVLLTGESGTGKDVAARTIHARSERVDQPFTNITCSALTETLLESELFGHEKGSFTGAHQLKKGLLEVSEGGTVFLDEIGEMSLAIQAKLLRFLESKTFRRVGGAKDITVEVRIVAATNRDLRDEVRAGRFREDLFYRLSVLHLHLPPLRERREDIPLLVTRLIEHFEREFHRRIKGVHPRTMERLVAAPWPGNVRELRNALERAVLLTTHELLDDEDFDFLDLTPVSGPQLLSTPPPPPPLPRTSAPPPPMPSSLYVLPPEGVDLHALERALLVQAVDRAHGNRTRAGRLLGLNRDQVRYRLAKLELENVTPDPDDPS